MALLLVMMQVVLMSATIEQQLFANYFARPVAGRLECAPVVKLDGRTYDVGEFYLWDIHELGPVSSHFITCSVLICLFIALLVSDNHHDTCLS